MNPKRGDGVQGPEPPTLVIQAVWVSPHQAQVAVKHSRNVPLPDIVGAIGEAMRLLVGGGQRPDGQRPDTEGPKVLQTKGPRPTYRPEKVA